MSALNDFKNVFGGSPTTFVNRFRKGVSVLKGMMKGEDFASNKLPIRLQIEVTDRCNYDCIMCNRLTRKNIRRKLNNDIAYHDFCRLIESIKPLYVTLNGLGEPLLHKDIAKMLSLCNSKRITTAMPCNLSVSSVLNTQVVNCLPNIMTFSIHGATKAVFESISRKSNYDQCMATLRHFLKIVNNSNRRNNGVSIRVLCAVQARNLFEWEPMFELLSGFGLIDNCYLVPAYDYGNNESDTRIIPTESEKAMAIEALDRFLQHTKEGKKAAFYTRWRSIIGEIVGRDSDGAKNESPCLIPWFSTYVAANGNVVPCCYLLDEHYVMGNVITTPFNSIWNGARYREFRMNIRENRGELEGCNYCRRNDMPRIVKYGFPFYSTMKWKRESSNHIYSHLH